MNFVDLLAAENQLRNRTNGAPIVLQPTASMGNLIMALLDDMARAASRDDVEAVARLLKTGHDINAIDGRGQTAFACACAHNAFRVAQMLFLRGADINTVDSEGGSPMDWAVVHSSPRFRAWLSSIGARRNDLSYPELAPDSSHRPDDLDELDDLD